MTPMTALTALAEIESKLRGVQCGDPACDSLIGAVLEIAREGMKKVRGRTPLEAVGSLGCDG